MKKDKKKDQLGMPFGTASSRLKKIIMFSMAQKLDLDLCFRCKDRIKTVEEFTVEHKEPWLDKNIELFWNLGNIAFSHAKCNRPSRPGRIPNPKHGGIQMYERNKCRCNICKSWKKKKNKATRKRRILRKMAR